MQKILTNSLFGILLIICSLGSIANLSAFTLQSSGLLFWLATVMGIIITLILSQSYMRAWISNHARLLLIIGALITVLIQISLIIWWPISIFHDPFRVLWQANHLLQHPGDWGTITYFWRYPNNVTLAILLSKWLWLTNLLHIPTLLSSQILALLLYDGFVLTLVWLVHKIKHDRFLTAVTGLFFVINPLSYGYAARVFYSDTPALLILTLLMGLILPLLSKPGRLTSWRFISLAILSLLGFLLKPNMIVILPALLIVLGLSYRKTLTAKKLFGVFLAILIGIMISLPTQSGLKSAAHFKPNARYELPMTSWIYMSLNPTTQGTYNSSDVKPLLALPDKADRSTVLRHKIPQRLKKLGIWGISKNSLLRVAHLTNLATANRSYIGGISKTPINGFNLQRWFGAFNRVYAPLLNSVLFILLSWVFIKQRRNLITQTTSLLLVTIILGYAAFHALVWETEARYGLSLLPLLILLTATFPTSDATMLIKWPRLLTVTTVVMTLGMGWLAIKHFSPLLSSPLSYAVATQRSQLSQQYGMQPTKLLAHQVYKQPLTLTTNANHISVLIDTRQSGMTYELMNTHTHKRYLLHPKRNTATLTTNLNKGTYQIIMQNHTDQPRHIMLTPDLIHKRNQLIYSVTKTIQ